MSRHLTAHSIDHVVLERGEVAHSWRTQRWDSLRLLTPNWMTRLPGSGYQGDDPHGYLSAPQVADFVAEYAATSGAPVITGTTVTAVRPGGHGFEVETDRGPWQARSVVLAVGASASGVQIAEELQRSGRPVTLAVGEHVRVPRRYRGRDILWWMDEV